MPQQIQVWVLEDDKQDWPLIDEECKKHGINVTFFDSALSMLAKLKTKPPVVLVIDYKLDNDVPNMNGFKVMLDAKEICEDCYFIIVTGQLPPLNSENIIIDFLNAHADQYIKKNAKNYYVTLAEQMIIGRNECKKRMENKEAIEKARQWLEDKLKYLNEKIEKLPGNDTRTDS